jgi:hypothetical protein
MGPPSRGRQPFKSPSRPAQKTKASLNPGNIRSRSLSSVRKNKKLAPDPILSVYNFIPARFPITKNEIINHWAKRALGDTTEFDIKLKKVISLYIYIAGLF